MKYTPRELKGNVNVSPYSPVKQFFLLLGGLLGIIIIVYLLLGLSVDAVVKRLPPGMENRLGKLFTSVYEGKAVSGRQEMLSGLLEYMAGQENSQRYNVRLVSSSIVNAMALPGGSIVFFSALVDEAESENELAFILAHELGHFKNRDHLKGLGRGLVMVALSTVLLGQDSSATKLIMNSLVSTEMKFSQRQERMADKFALDLLNERYGHAGGALEFFKRVGDREKKGKLAYYFATHPHPHDRVEVLKRHIKENGYREEAVVPIVYSGRSKKPKVY